MIRYLRKLRKRKNSDAEELPEEHPFSVTPLTASCDHSVKVYDINTSGEPCAVFQGHDDGVLDVVQLESNLVASVGDDKRLFTWRARTAEMVGEWVHDAAITSVEKFDESKIIVAEWNRRSIQRPSNVLVLTHQSASSFQLHRRLSDSHSYYINGITVHSDLFVTCSGDRTAKVWDTNSLTLRATLPHDGGVFSAAVSDRKIVTTCSDKKIRVFQNGPDFNLLFDLSEIADEISFLNDDIVAAAAERHLYFISLPAKSVLSRVRMEDTVDSFKVLSDGRIAVGGSTHPYCAIVTPPKLVRGPIEDCVTSLYPSSPIARARAPLRAAWLDVQDQQLTIADTCKTAITSENCASSLDEWCIAHNLLMEAVKRGEILASRHLHDSIAHWHQVLYQHCAKLAMGEKCIGGVKLLFKEAEDAGVIAEGQIESLINTIAIRQDMDADNRFLVHAAYQLFMRQAEMDVRLAEVLHYQHVQQVASVFNALIGCVPIGGAIVTNVMSGGASILNDLQVCGLVESVLGIGKDVSGGFGSDSLVDRVLRKSNDVLSVEEWEKLPAEKRTVVEDAASNLGLSIEELRKKLQIVAAMQLDQDSTPSELVVIEEVDDNANIRPVMPTEDDSDGVPSLSVNSSGVDVASSPAQGSSASNMTTTRPRHEMKWWKKKGISKNVTKTLESREVGECFAAFFLNYEAERGEEYSRLAEIMTKVFQRKTIYGESFVEANEEVLKVMLAVIVKALAKVTDEDAEMMTKMRVEKFLLLASR